MVVLDKIGVTYPSPRGEVVALESLSLRVNKGEFVFLLGPSGCGKSTLLRLVAGLTSPTSGTISFPGYTNPRVRLVFQDHSLFPWMNVLDNAAFGLEMDGAPVKERRQKALEMLAVMGIAEFSRHFPHELSGGMKQRVAIARAFVTEPDVLLMDEPLRALDEPLRLLLLEELERLWQIRRPTILYVTHEIEEAVLWGDRVVVLGGRPGRLLEEINLNWERPRVATGRGHPEREEIKWHVWDLLKAELQRQGQLLPSA